MASTEEFEAYDHEGGVRTVSVEVDEHGQPLYETIDAGGESYQWNSYSGAFVALA
ncbi:hypothetical protein [Nesterenkonia populi]